VMVTALAEEPSAITSAAAPSDIKTRFTTFLQWTDSDLLNCADQKRQ
jgi:hypothetical protein